MSVELSLRCDREKHLTEDYAVHDTLKTYDSHGLCELKRYLALCGGLAKVHVPTYARGNRSYTVGWHRGKKSA